MRINKLKESLARDGLDAYIVAREPNIIYYTGSISGGLLVVTPDTESTLLAPSLNLAVAKEQASGINVEPYKRDNMLDKLKGALTGVNPEKVGFDELSLGNHRKIGEALGCELVEKPSLVMDMRRVKEPVEIKLMRRAAALVDTGMKAAMEFIKPGATEHEIAAEAAYAMRRNGAEDYAFPFIVASGHRSAFPHAGVTDRVVQSGDFVKIDMGARYRGYCSDLTRTFIVGPPSAKQREIYTAVLEANEAAFPHYRAGEAGVDVDAASRRVIEEKGYGEYYIHGLGHGIGLEVHEPPSASTASKDTLQAWNVLSNEPGIYLPGYGGVRIEDTVLVTESEPEALTRFPKALSEVIL